MAVQLRGSFHLDPIYSEIVHKKHDLKFSTYRQIFKFRH